MSRISGLLLAACLTCAPLPANADNASEIVYRASLGSSDDVAYLIKEGASPNQKDSHGTPILALAAARTDGEGLKVIETLVNAGADINAKDAAGQSALFYAGRQGNAKAVQYLMSKGIDYYAIDNHGDIARTIAFRAGHKDIVDLMDKFVKDQAANVNKQYQDLNNTLMERYRQQQQVSQPQPAAPALPSPQPTPKPAPTEEKIAAAPQAPETKPKPPAPAAPSQDEIKKAAEDLAFNMCAYQYWSYCDAVKQSTELSADELDTVMDSSRDAAAAMSEKLTRQYRKPPQFANHIELSAKQRIFNQLNMLISNVNRHEFGVGKKDDMETRCQQIAREWDAEPPGIEKPRGSTGGGGLVGGGKGNGSGFSKKPGGKHARAKGGRHHGGKPGAAAGLSPHHKHHRKGHRESPLNDNAPAMSAFPSQPQTGGFGQSSGFGQGTGGFRQGQ